MIKRRKLSQKLLFVLIIATATGNVAQVFGVKLSYIALFATVAAFVYELSRRKYQLFIKKRTKQLILFMLVWIAYGLIQVIWVQDISLWIAFYRNLLINTVLVILLTLSIKTISDATYFIGATKIGLALNLLLAIWECATGRHIVSWNDDNFWALGWPRTFFGNANDVSTFVALSILLLIFGIFLKHKVHWDDIALLVGSGMLLNLLHSRAVQYGLLIGIVTFILCYLFKFFSKFNYKVMSTVFIVMGLVGVILVGAILIQTPVTTLLAKLGNSSDVKSDLYRIEVIRKGMEKFVHSGFMGVGAGQSAYYVGTNLHNFLLEILVDFGFVIGLGVMAIIIVPIYDLWRKKDVFFCIKAFCVAFIPSLLVIGVSSSGMNRIRITWILIPIIYKVAILLQEYKTEHNKLKDVENAKWLKMMKKT